MQKARDYLRANGINVGNKGRLNEVSRLTLEIAMLKGTVFEDYDKDGFKKTQAAPAKRQIKVAGKTYSAPIAPETPVRGANRLRIVDKRGTVINLSDCDKCKKYIPYCKCKTIEPPSWILDVDHYELVISE